MQNHNGKIPINSVADAALIFRQPAILSEYEAQRLAQIKSSPDSWVVLSKNGRILVGLIGAPVRSRKELNAQSRHLGYAGRGFFIERTDGTRLVSHNMWSDDWVDDRLVDHYMPFVNTLVFREATREESNQWFAECEAGIV